MYINQLGYIVVLVDSLTQFAYPEYAEHAIAENAANTLLQWEHVCTRLPFRACH